jgi:hypothetical protein
MVARTSWWGYLVAIALLLTAFCNADGLNARDFQCRLCRSFVDALTATASPSRLVDEKSLVSSALIFQHLEPQQQVPQQRPVTAVEVLRACRTSGPFDSCEFTAPALKRLLGARPVSEARALLGELGDDACGRMELCPVNELWRAATATDTGANLDIRVALGHIHRGYGNLRVSVVDNDAATHDQAFLDFFEYNAPFKYSWTNKTLHTTVRPVTPGLSSVWNVGTELTLNVTLPPQGQGVRGFLVADPCFSSEHLVCQYANEWKIFERLPKMLNAGLESDNDFWFLGGDNFYDPYGTVTPRFFTQLTQAAKSKPIVSVVGNHDLFEYGALTVGGKHTFGNGYMQYYLMDTASALNQTDGVPLNFSIDPADTTGPRFPPVDDFFTLNVIGDVMMMSFSAAYTFEESKPLFDDACRTANQLQPKWFLVLGHWSAVEAGCQPNMTAEDVYEYIVTVDACQNMSHRIKWVEGHAHCNQVMRADTGFRVGSFGMGGCNNFGFPYLDTTGDKLEIGYFPIIGFDGALPGTATSNVDFDTLHACVRAHGIGGCKQYAVTWMSQQYTAAAVGVPAPNAGDPSEAPPPARVVVSGAPAPPLFFRERFFALPVILFIFVVLLSYQI